MTRRTSGKWEMRMLGEICEINPSRQEIKELADEADVSFVPMAAVSEQGTLTEMKVRKVREVANGFPHFKDNDLLLAKITPCFENGKRWVAQNLVNKIGFGSTEFHILRCGKDVLPKWIFYCVSHPSFRKQAELSMTGSAGQKRVPSSFLKKQQIPVPPLHIQQKIVSILEKVEALKPLRKEANELTKRFLSSLFLEMFSKGITNESSHITLEQVTTRITDGEHDTPRRVNDGIYLLSARNILNHNISLEDVDFIDEAEYARICKRIKPQVGDVLVSCSGTVGRVARVKDPFRFQLVRSVALIRPDVMKLNPIYLEYFFETNYMQKQILKSINQANQANLFQGQIRKLKVYLPSLAMQNKFADIVREVELATKHQKRLEQHVDNLFDSLILRAFKGELTC